jgi:small subunit ribosomal protein S16
MSVKIRMTRVGRTNRPHFRIVATDTRSPRDGNHLEILGHYNPIEKDKAKKKYVLHEDRIRYWLSKGALPSVTVSKFLRETGIRTGPSPGAAKAPGSKPAAAPAGKKKDARS